MCCARRNFLSATAPGQEHRAVMGLLDGKTAAHYRALCLGQDDAPVIQSKAPQTVSVEDSFWPQLLTSIASIKATLDRLALTLMVKIRQDQAWFGTRRPATIALAVRMHAVSFNPRKPGTAAAYSTSPSKAKTSGTSTHHSPHSPHSPHSSTATAAAKTKPERMTRESRQEKLDTAAFPTRLPPLHSPVHDAQDLPAGDREIARHLAARGALLFLKMYPEGARFACHIVNISVKYPTKAPSHGSVPITQFMAPVVAATQGGRASTGSSGTGSPSRSPAGHHRTQIGDRAMGASMSTAVSPRTRAQAEGDTQHALTGGDRGGGSSGAFGMKSKSNVRQYFGTSRLSFIGTWKTRFKQFMRKLQHSQGSQAAGTDASARAGVPQNTAFAQQLDAARRRPCNTIPAHRACTPEWWYMHIDVDCFFVSVALHNRTDIAQDTPVAVVSGLDSSSEVCSANYPARGKGLHANMFVKEARKRCPGIVLIPTSPALFEKLAAASQSMYTVLLQATDKIQPISCDEMYVQVDANEWTVGITELAHILRHGIKEKAGCPVSIGVGHSSIVARFATKIAKPPSGDGVHSVGTANDAKDLLADTPVRMLSGIGRATADKLETLGVQCCHQLLAVPLGRLQKEFGNETSRQITCMAQGNDHAPNDFDVWKIVNELPKSVQNDVNWGVRLATLAEAKSLISDIAAHVTNRLADEGLVAGSATLKIRNRRPGAAEPAKAGGHGSCDQWSRTAKVSPASDAASIITSACHGLVLLNNREVSQIRGQ